MAKEEAESLVSEVEESAAQDVDVDESAAQDVDVEEFAAQDVDVEDEPMAESVCKQELDIEENSWEEPPRR